MFVFHSGSFDIYPFFLCFMLPLSEECVWSFHIHCIDWLNYTDGYDIKAAHNSLNTHTDFKPGLFSDRSTCSEPFFYSSNMKKKLFFH